MNLQFAILQFCNFWRIHYRDMTTLHVILKTVKKAVSQRSHSGGISEGVFIERKRLYHKDALTSHRHVHIS